MYWYVEEIQGKGSSLEFAAFLRTVAATAAAPRQELSPTCGRGVPASVAAEPRQQQRDAVRP